MLLFRVPAPCLLLSRTHSLERPLQSTYRLAEWRDYLFLRTPVYSSWVLVWIVVVTLVESCTSVYVAVVVTVLQALQPVMQIPTAIMVIMISFFIRVEFWMPNSIRR